MDSRIFAIIVYTLSNLNFSMMTSAITVVVSIFPLKYGAQMLVVTDIVHH